MGSQKRTGSNWIAGILAILLAQICLVAFLKMPGFAERLGRFGNENLLFYCLYLFSFLFCFLSGAFVLRKVSVEITIPGQWKLVIGAGCLLAALLFLLLIFKNEEQLLGMVLSLGVVEPFLWLRVPKIFSIFIVLIFSAFVFLQIKNQQCPENAPGCRRTDMKLQNSHKKIGRGYEFYLFYGVMAALSGYSLYMPNYLQADPLHGHAYYVSMYNVVHGRAYDDLFTSMYGHYGIFFKWPLKIIGNGNMKDAAFLIAVLGALSAFFIMFVIHYFCKNGVIRILGGFASVLPVMGLRLNNYWQVQPHRVLFSSIFLIYTVFYLKNRTKWRAVFGYLLGALAVVWNTETGMVCALAWAALQCYLYLDTHAFWSINTFVFFTKQVIGTSGSFMGAYSVVNVYNLLHGGEINGLKTFLYPLLYDEYMTGYLRTNLPAAVGGYLLVLLLFLGGLVWSLSDHFLLNKEKKGKSSEKRAFVFFTAVLGLGQITYFINRPEYFNLDIIYTIFVVLVCVYLETAVHLGIDLSWGRLKEKSWKELLKINVAIIMTIVITALSLGTFVQTGHQLNERSLKGYQNMESLYAFLEELKLDVPINTFGFGQGVPELYGLMGWDTRCHVIDFSDRTELSLQYVRDSLEHEMGFFAFIQDAEFILEEQQGIWYIYKTYEYAGDQYAFFLRQ